MTIWLSVINFFTVPQKTLKCNGAFPFQRVKKKAESRYRWLTQYRRGLSVLQLSAGVSLFRVTIEPLMHFAHETQRCALRTVRSICFQLFSPLYCQLDVALDFSNFFRCRSRSVAYRISRSPVPRLATRIAETICTWEKESRRSERNNPRDIIQPAGSFRIVINGTARSGWGCSMVH